MVYGVDGKRLRLIQRIEHRLAAYPHRMGGLAPVGVLAVLYQAVACCRGCAACSVCGGKALGYVLVNLAVEGRNERLYATAYSEHRYLAVVCQPYGQQLGLVAHVVDAVQARRRLLAGPQRIDVAASGEHQSVYLVERVDYHVLVGNGRNYHRRASGSHHGHVILLAQTRVAVGKIACEANHRLASGLRITGVYVVETALNIKRFHCSSLTLSAFSLRNGHFSLDALL